ncbi:unnamed protein product [Rotaria magnacalcarata]|uniref:Uncharacterized protein n=1 Tax=Rotaria magnacalcarata TaxID=392030 RepID=A0A819YJM4_9BILA|nr:unnamed protein product [Rotaria magnacalcarata]
MHSGISVQTLHVIREFDKFFSTIDYPHSIHRRVGNFRSHNDWKAAQLRLFLLYLALPFLLFFSECFPPLLIYHFSLYSIYIRTLCYFNNRKHVYDARLFIEAHLHRFSEFYKNAKELLSTHCNMHLWQQVIHHGSLTATSMFGSESCLHGLYKLAHGTRHVGGQIAYWYTIHRSIHSMSIKNQPTAIRHPHFMNGYIDERIIKKSVVFRSRYKTGLVVYHSLSHSFRKQSSSFNLLVTESLEKCLQSPFLKAMLLNELYQLHLHHINIALHLNIDLHRNINLHLNVHLHFNINLHLFINRLIKQSTTYLHLNINHPAKQRTNYFGPVRASLVQNQPRTITSSYSQHRASPYTVNSSRMNRRQGGMSRPQLDTFTPKSVYQTKRIDGFHRCLFLLSFLNICSSYLTRPKMSQRLILIVVLVCIAPLSIAGGGKAQSSYQNKAPSLIEKLTKLMEQREEKLFQKLTVFESIICSLKIRCKHVDASAWTNPVHAIVCPKYKLFIESDKCPKDDI